MVRGPDGGFGCTFYQYHSSDLGSVYYATLDEEMNGAVRMVVDSIATSAGAGVYIDMALTPDWGWHISYRNDVEQILYYASADSVKVTGVEDDTPIAPPGVFRLYQNNPNPFNPQTVITYSIPSTGRVGLSIYDVKGRLIKTLVNGLKPAGRHSLTWNARDNRGIAVASGVYFIRLVSGGQTQTRKLVLLK
jgi:hypothetical protein